MPIERTIINTLQHFRDFPFFRLLSILTAPTLLCSALHHGPLDKLFFASGTTGVAARWLQACVSSSSFVDYGYYKAPPTSLRAQKINTKTQLIREEGTDKSVRVRVCEGFASCVLSSFLLNPSAMFAFVMLITAGKLFAPSFHIPLKNTIPTAVCSS